MVFRVCVEIRELQIIDCEIGVDKTFSEIIELSKRCKFTNCSHATEPGCAVRQAIDVGEIQERRLPSYRKLIKEQAVNSETLAERRAREREFTRYVRSVINHKKNNKQ